MIKCYLNGHGLCGGGITREHAISQSILRQLSKGKTATIGGLPWQPSETLQDIGIASLQSKVLCAAHNRACSPLDAAASRFVETMDSIDKRPQTLPVTTQIDGEAFERWLLKLICGLVAGQRLADGVVPDEWKSVLAGGSWPENWGLYFATGGESLIFAKDIYFESKVHPETKRILAGHFNIAGTPMWLLLGRPDNPKAWGVHRPLGLVFDLGDDERRIEFVWPFDTHGTVKYTKTGTTLRGPAHRDGWETEAA